MFWYAWTCGASLGWGLRVDAQKVLVCLHVQALDSVGKHEKDPVSFLLIRTHGHTRINTHTHAQVENRQTHRGMGTSMVLPLLAVRMSPGRMASADTMFSQAATMKCASTSAGLSMPIAMAVPRVAAPPPMSNCHVLVCWYVLI